MTFSRNDKSWKKAAGPGMLWKSVELKWSQVPGGVLPEKLGRGVRPGS